MLTDKITVDDIKKIFSNQKNKVAYLTQLFDFCNMELNLPKNNSDIEQLIIDTWSYEPSKTIIRNLFKTHPKYIEQEKLEEKIDNAIEEWNDIGLGEFEWPFSAMSFDQHVHILNRNQEYTEKEKDEILTKEIIKFRRIKHINALRNDFVEFLIFKNENVIPTLGNKKGVDFYIDGEPYDQKVGKSVGAAFKQQYGDNYREIALSHPELVAKSLYENQDEERFGDEPRLLIVYLDSEVDSQSIDKQLSEIDFSTPYEVEFEYKHSNNITVKHRTKCFVVLLHN